MKVRVRESVVVELPEVGTPITLRAGDMYDSNDPMVKEYGWAFEADNIEQATASPGEKRTTVRR